MSSRYLPSGRSLYLPANIQKIQKIQKSQHPRIPTSEYSREFRYSVDLLALFSKIFTKRLSHFSYFVTSRLQFHISISSCCSRSKLHTSKHSLVSRHVHLLFEQFFQIFKILQTQIHGLIFLSPVTRLLTRQMLSTIFSPLIPGASLTCAITPLLTSPNLIVFPYVR
jgi:hypothetical protein